MKVDVSPVLHVMSWIYKYLHLFINSQKATRGEISYHLNVSHTLLKYRERVVEDFNKLKLLDKVSADHVFATRLDALTYLHEKTKS